MKIVYSLSMEDYIAVNQYLAETNPEYQRQLKQIRVMQAASFMVPFLIFALATKDAHNQNLWIGSAVLGTFLFFLNFILYPASEKKQREKNLRIFHQSKHGFGNIGTYTMELLGDALRVNGPLGEETYTLSFISEITQNDSYFLLRKQWIFIVISRKNIIEGDPEKFVRELESRIPPAPPLLVEPSAASPQKASFWTGRRAIVASLLCCLTTILSVYLLKNCGCGHLKIAPKSLALSIALSGAFTIVFLDLGIGLLKKEKQLRRDQASNK